VLNSVVVVLRGVACTRRWTRSTHVCSAYAKWPHAWREVRLPYVTSTGSTSTRSSDVRATDTSCKYESVEVRYRTRSTTAVRNICGCAAPCSEISYDVSYSLSRWPAESFDGDEAYSDIFMAIIFYNLHIFTLFSGCRLRLPQHSNNQKR